MPINVCVQAKDKNNKCFDGKVRISLKQNTPIGYLKVSVDYKELQGLTDTFSFSKYASLQDENKIVNLDEENNFLGPGVRENLWDCFYYNYYDINKVFLEKFFLVNFDSNITASKSFYILINSN